LPVVTENGPHDEGRSHHRTNRSSDVIDAACETSFFRGKPFSSSFHAGRVCGTFAKSQQRSEAGEHWPTMGEAVCHVHQRPRGCEHCQANPETKNIHHVAAQRLKHDGDLKRSDDV